MIRLDALVVEIPFLRKTHLFLLASRIRYPRLAGLCLEPAGDETKVCLKQKKKALERNTVVHVPQCRTGEH